MALDDAWKSGLTFSDRLESVVNIIAAKRSLAPAQDFSTAQSEAKATEEHSFAIAKSKAEYQALCRSIVQKLLDKAEPSGSPTEPIEARHEASADGIDVGSYKNATFWRNGLVSTVYKARSKAGELVALKVTTPSISNAPHDSEREARVLRAVANTKIIPLLESFSQPGGHFILAFPFMPYDLADMVGQHTLTLDQVRSHLRDLFQALAHLHSVGIIHRDVKPSNILLASPDGPAYLADFGIVWAPNDRASEPADHKFTDVGTTSYRPPELLFGNTGYGTSLDLWAAGCTVAEAIRLDNKPLFTSGELGSELALIQSIFSTLGTPNLDVWPEAKDLPDWGKMAFREYPPTPWTEILKDVPEHGRNLAASLVRYESGERLKAAEALNHPFFRDVP